MKKLLSLLLITLFITSCGVNHTDFSGDWVEKEKENDRMVIKKNGDNYIVKNEEKKYPAQIKDGLLEISAQFPLKATIDENDNLIVAGKVYIRIENSMLNNYLGKWIRSSGETYSANQILIENVNNEIAITVNERGLPTEYRNIKYRNKEITFKKWGSEGGMEFSNYGKFKILDNGEISEIINGKEFGRFTLFR